MKRGDILYFSPKYKFSDLQWDNKDALIDAFRDRVEGFYLNPADELNQNYCAFSAGVMCVTSIDFLARITSGVEKVTRKEFESWLKHNIEPFDESDPDNASQSLAKRFYHEFRCGLVHEGRIKNAGQFSYHFEKLIEIKESAMIVNPHALLNAIEESFTQYIDKVKNDDFAFQSFKCALIRDFRKEVELVKTLKN